MMSSMFSVETSAWKIHWVEISFHGFSDEVTKLGELRTVKEFKTFKGEQF